MLNYNISKMGFPSKTSFTFLFILTLFILTLYTALHRPYCPTSTAPPPPLSSNKYNTVHYQNIFLSSASNYTLATYLRRLTLHPTSPVLSLLFGQPFTSSPISKLSALKPTSLTTLFFSPTLYSPLSKPISATAPPLTFLYPNRKCSETASWTLTTPTPPPGRRWVNPCF